MKSTMSLCLAMGILVTAAGSGCSIVQSWRQTAEGSDVGTLREQRREEIVTDFERRRLAAQLKSAQQRAEQGDPEAAEEILLGLISRDEKNVAARLQLAELYWAHEQLPQAEQQLRAALSTAPERADVHHLLGLVLDAQGNTTEAEALLAKAAELDPGNELFRLTAAAANATSPSGPGSASAIQPAAVWTE